MSRKKSITPLVPKGKQKEVSHPFGFERLVEKSKPRSQDRRQGQGKEAEYQVGRAVVIFGVGYSPK